MLPALTEANVRLFAVGIGSADAAREFAERIDFPTELLMADESEDSLAHAAAGTRNTRRDENGKAVFEGVESMWSSRTTEGIEARGRDDLNGVIGGLFKPGPYKPLMPKGKGLFDPKVMERTMVQGGAFVFDGDQELFAHLDFSSGAAAPSEKCHCSAVPLLGSCASSGCAWRLRAAQHAQGVRPSHWSPSHRPGCSSQPPPKPPISPPLTPFRRPCGPGRAGAAGDPEG